jgi:hypothetical protein
MWLKMAVGSFGFRSTVLKERLPKHFQKMMIEQRSVYLAVGMGQAHYFFQKEAEVIWLAVDPSLAKEAIRDAVRKIR